MIDFEAKFTEYLKAYEKKHSVSDEQLEEIVPDLYLSWLDSPKEWLKGKSPVDYFAGFNAAALIELLGKYIISEVTLPGALLNRIADTKKETYPYLINLLTKYEGEKQNKIKHTIVRLIEEMDFAHPYEYYIEAISQADEKNDFTESAAEELKNSGGKYQEQIIAAYEQAKNNYISDCLLDILCDIGADKRVYQFALDKFLFSESGRAFYASCLGKLGYADAVPYLEEALRENNIGYFDYTAIKDAVEELGGEVTIDRDFSGDSDYESLKKPEE